MQYKVITGAFPCVPQKRVLHARDVVDETFFLQGQLSQEAADTQIAEGLQAGFIVEAEEEDGSEVELELVTFTVTQEYIDANPTLGFTVGDETKLDATEAAKFAVLAVVANPAAPVTKPETQKNSTGQRQQNFRRGGK